MPPKRRLNRARERLTDLGFRGPSEECGTLSIWCGMSVDTRMALGGDDVGRYDTLRGDETVSRPELVGDSVWYEPVSHRRVTATLPECDHEIHFTSSLHFTS